MVPTAPRRALRASAVAAGISLVSLPSPAFAVPPETWEQPDNGPLLEQLLILVGIPLAIIAVITLLTYLPSLTHRRTEEPALTFGERSEWFGGPRQGVDAAGEPPVEQSSGKGGASGSW